MTNQGRWFPVAIPPRLRLLLLVAGPLLVALAAGLGLPHRLLDAVSPAGAADNARALQERFEQVLAESASITDAALDGSPWTTFRHRDAGVVGARLEGIGTLGPELDYEAWAGTPVEPGSPLGAADLPRWSVRLDGVRTRLVVRGGPDETGRVAVASFIIDGLLPDSSFEALLPRDLLTRVGLDVEFRDTYASSGAAAGRPVLETAPGEGEQEVSREQVVLVSPAGDVLATATLHPVPPERLRQRQGAAGRAWAAALFPLLLLSLFDWPRISARPRGCLLALLAIGVCRAGLLLTRAPAVLLPRELGSATLFGASSAAGLVASPVDLLLSGLGLYLAALALRNCARTLGGLRRWSSCALSLPAAAAFSAVAFWLGVAVARHSTVPVLEEAGFTGWNAASLTVLGLSFALLGAAELWSHCWVFLRWRDAAPRRAADRIPVALAVIVVVAACSGLTQRVSTRLGVERLSAEFAPMVLEQSARRSVALSAALRRIEQAYRDASPPSVPASSQSAFLAYHFWLTGDLFLAGYKSSLDFYNANGDRISHFAFDLPAWDEEIEPAPELPGQLIIREEETPDPAALVQQRLLHAEITIVRGGELLGVVVGHVLDEPENLPFLPWSQPYLAALGPGAPYGVDDPFARDLQYVLYDESGRVRLTTLAQPPALTPQLRGAAARAGRVRLRAGEEDYYGLSLGDRGRLHLLLLPARGLFEHVASAVRLATVPLMLLALLALAPLLAPPHGPAFLLQRLRQSFRRKLLAALLAASIIPLVGLALFLQGYVERRGDKTLIGSATQFVGAAQRQLEAYAAYASDDDEAPVEIDDWVVHWLRGLVGQEIHVFENGLLSATSKRELFDSGLLPLRLDGEVERRLVGEGRPSLVVPTRIGPSEIPVAYAPVRGTAPGSGLVVAVPIVAEERQIARDVDRVVEMILLATVLLVCLLAVTATYVSRTVARPVRDLVGATARIASGDYAARLEPRTADEMAELVRGFNSMAAALGAQRQDLERRRDYMERLLRHATTGVISTDPEGRVVTLNPAALDLLSAAGARLEVGADLVRALEATAELRPLAPLLRSSAPQSGEPEDIDLELGGSPHRFRLMRVDLPDPSGGAVGRLILLEDVTQLMRSNQLAAWAEMARSIAHEIKNPLTPIQLSTEHLRRLLRDRGVLPDPGVEACLETVIKQVRTLYQIAGEFSAYAKLPALTPEPVDPVAFMRTTIGPYSAASPPNVTIREQYEPAGKVAIDGKVLSRAVVNLVENALQAMPEGGTLTVGVSADDERGEVLLSVRDEGPGLSRDVRRRLFDPYFSTKSSGTGLGLAIARRVVEAHQGAIEVDSELGRGTTFTIRLPRVESA